MTRPAPAQLREIGQIAIPVQDLARAVRFYRDTLGMPLLFEAPPGLAFFDCGGVRLMLSGAEPDAEGREVRRASILYYRVPDIQRAFADLSAAGVAFMEAPHRIARLPDHDLWLAAFSDSEDNMLALMSEVRPPEPQ